MLVRRRAAAALTSVLLAAGLSTPGTASAGAEVAVVANLATSTDARKVITRDVRLGHKPVRLTSRSTERARTARLTFRGRSGQLVEAAHWPEYEVWEGTACLRKRLFRDGRRVERWAPGYWRLRRTATYTAVVKPCGDSLPHSVTLQVRKVVVRDAAVDGPGTTVGSNPDVTHLVRIPLMTGERLTLTARRFSWFSNAARHLLQPDRGALTHLHDSHTTLEDGWRPSEHGEPTTTGLHHLAVRPGGTVTVSRARAYAGAVDGAAVTLGNDGVPAREHLVSFAGQAGQWVYPELLRADGTRVLQPRLGVLAPTSAVTSYVATTCPGAETTTPCHQGVAGPWQLPATGSYRMSVTVPGSAAADTFTVRVRAAVEAPMLEVDGPPVTYTATTPGQWVVGRYTEDLHWGAAMATATNASASLSDWRMTLVTGFPNQCGFEHSNGCPDYWSTQLTPSAPQLPTPHDGNIGPSVAVLAVPPGVQGTIDLRLTRR